MRLKAIVGFFLFAMGVTVSSASARGTTACTMKYNLRGWSAFYKTASGAGTIRCDNGQRATVRLSARGGGLTAGKAASATALIKGNVHLNLAGTGRGFELGLSLGRFTIARK